MSGEDWVVKVLAVFAIPTLLQLAEKVAEAEKLGFAEVTLVIEKNRLRFIRGPAPSEPIKQ